MGSMRVSKIGIRCVSTSILLLGARSISPKERFVSGSDFGHDVVASRFQERQERISRKAVGGQSSETGLVEIGVAATGAFKKHTGLRREEHKSEEQELRQPLKVSGVVDDGSTWGDEPQIVLNATDSGTDAAGVARPLHRHMAPTSLGEEDEDAEEDAQELIKAARAQSRSMPHNASSLVQLSDGDEEGSQSTRRRRRRFRMGASFTTDFNGSGYDDILDMTEGRLFGPMTIQFTARWDAFNKWSRIMDFGRGPRDNNIIVANTATPKELAFFIYDGALAKGFTIQGAIELGTPAAYQLTVGSTGRMKVWKDGKIIGEWDDGLVPRKVFRNHFYVAKSNWETTPLFQGLIEDLYIFPGDATRWGERDGIVQ